MQQQEMLHIDWNDDEAATYYIDKDNYSKAIRIGVNEIHLRAFEGIYVFNETNGEVKLYSNGKFKTVTVKHWKTYRD